MLQIAKAGNSAGCQCKTVRPDTKKLRLKRSLIKYKILYIVQLCNENLRYHGSREHC